MSSSLQARPPIGQLGGRLGHRGRPARTSPGGLADVSTTMPASEQRLDEVRVDLPVSGRKVSVVGNGARAAVTPADLVSRGASVVVHTEAHLPVAPSICDMAARGHLLLAADGPTGMCLKGVWLVFACTDGESTDLAAAVHADRAGVWCIPTPGRGTLGPATRSTPQEPGSVTIIGGGPGDPGLLTVRGRAALLKAEVVVFDRLAPISVLAELDRSVLLIDASKVPNGRATPQTEINRLLIEHARAGRRVVRLKGGDPFVFGRGLEEVQACHKAGLVADVVPGVSSAISVPGSAGVSLTHRGLLVGLGCDPGVQFVLGLTEYGHDERRHEVDRRDRHEHDPNDVARRGRAVFMRQQTPRAPGAPPLPLPGVGRRHRVRPSAEGRAADRGSYRTER